MNKKIVYYSIACGLHDLKFIRILSRLSKEVLVVSKKGTCLPRELWGKVDFVSLSNQGSKPLIRREAIRKLKIILKDHQTQVTIAGPLWPCAYEAAAAKSPNLVATSWAFDVLVDAKRSEKIRSAISFALSAAEIIMFDSPWICSVAQELKSFSKRKARVFSWGVDTELFRPASEVNQSSQREFEILHTRTLDKLYRPEVVLRAFQIANQKKINFRLRLMAFGPLLPKMQKLSKTLGIEQNVKWMTPIENNELPEILQKTSLYTSASCSDGVSISLLEAMACGLPAVVSDLPSNIHLLSPWHRKQTFRLDDPESLAQKWISLSELPQKLWFNIGEANREKAIKTGHFRKFEKKYSDTISDLLKGQTLTS